ncbi:MAG: hypothetical protein JWP16_1096 [Alphaproteobacteria bacterium]|jgi:hypothetical protein|nr:hypothetical protein [Alphaproteobacteria bacterium]MDB5740056.1 hypothetical protein [Alphaproteobacteria bacterium]
MRNSAWAGFGHTDMAMTRIPNQLDLSADELKTLRDIVGRSFTPIGQINVQQRSRLLELGLILGGMGGLMPTPAGRIVARL